jgi:hypothetical protein
VILFAQSISGEVKKWFNALPATSIPNFATFEATFLEIWGDKKNPLQLLNRYNNVNRSPSETVKEFFYYYLGWLSLMSTNEESSVENFGSTKVWAMDPSLFYL